MFSPINEKPLEPEEVLIPPHDLLGRLPGAGVRYVIKMCYWAGFVIFSKAAVILQNIKPRQERALVVCPVNQCVANVSHNRFKHRVCDSTIFVFNCGGRHQEVAAQLTQSIEWPLHILNFETHIAYCIHRRGWVDIVEAPWLMPLGVFPHQDPMRIGWGCVLHLIQSPAIRSLIHDEKGSPFPQR